MEKDDVGQPSPMWSHHQVSSAPRCNVDVHVLCRFPCAKVKAKGPCGRSKERGDVRGIAEPPRAIAVHIEQDAASTRRAVFHVRGRARCAGEFNAAIGVAHEADRSGAQEAEGEARGDHRQRSGRHDKGDSRAVDDRRCEQRLEQLAHQRRTVHVDAHLGLPRERGVEQQNPGQQIRDKMTQGA
eukprot:6580604-Prymnesium_polylepis.1